MRLLRTLASLAILFGGAVWADGPIRFKTRTIEPMRMPRAHARAGHLVLRFDARPGPRLLAELAHRRIRVLSYLPDTALMVAIEGEPDLTGLGVTWAGPLEAADKISPALGGDPASVYLVMFHPDVPAGPARGVVQQHGLQLLETGGLLPGHLLVAGDLERVARLAALDEVAYILPARTEMAVRRRLYGCPGPLTPAGSIAEYALAGNGWPKDASGGVMLGYFFQTLTPKLDANAARSAIERALAEWSRYAEVRFSPAQQQASARSVDILFGAGAHGDSYPFSSVNVLAHAFFPAPPNAEPVAGDIHFNAVENWDSGIDLFSVALHEAGHALGLGHSDNPDAVMYPYYQLSAGLTSDDIAAVQALYGQASSNPVNPPIHPPVTSGGNPTGGSGNPTGSGGSGGTDTTPPSLAITSPGSTIVATTAASITVSGTAADNVGVVSVKWSTSTGSSGTAAGGANWSAAVPLLVGTNAITVRAYDAAGNSGWRALTVVRQ